jgi:hypothetical protein
MKDIKLEAFKILSMSQYDLIAKVLYDNGIKNDVEYVAWLKTIPDGVIPNHMSVNVHSSIRDIQTKFTDPNKVPNIFKLKP